MSLDTAETRYGIFGTSGAFAAQRWVDTMKQAATDTPIPFVEEPSETQSLVELPVYVNHGRWVVDCPFCRAGQFASRSDHRFYCAECQNAAIGGVFVKTVWPKDAAKIEEALLERPNLLNQNWVPGETVKQLHAEHKEAIKAQMAMPEDDV